METVYASKAPEPIGPYSQAVKAGDFVFTSGQLGIGGDGKLEADVSLQTEAALKNLSEVLREAGSSLDMVVKTTCYLANISDSNDFNQIYEKYFLNKPARTLIEASALPKGALVKIEAVAEIKGEKI